MNFTDPETLTKLGKLIITDLVLAGDNALVIALATRSLGPKQRFWGQIIGAGGAVVLRVLFVWIIAWLLAIPYLQLGGGLLLIWIGWKLVRPQEEALDAAAHEGKIKASTLREAVSVIIIADVTMSFDNVVAISNIAGDSIPLVIFGLLLSIPLVVWGSVLISKLMDRYRWIVWLGGAVLGHVAGEIIFKDRLVLGWMGISIDAKATTAAHDAAVAAASPAIQAIVHGVPWILAIGLLLAGWLFHRHATAKKRAGLGA